MARTRFDNLEFHRATPLHPLLKDLVADHDRRVQAELAKWRSFGGTRELRTQDVHGRRVMYGGISFEGSPQVVFWKRFFQEFLEHATRHVIAQVLEECAKRNLEPNTYLAEVRTLLRAFIRRTYEDMADADRHLRRKGLSELPAKRDIAQYVKTMETFLDDRILAAAHRTPRGGGAESRDAMLEVKPSFAGITVNVKEVVRRLLRRGSDLRD